MLLFTSLLGGVQVSGGILSISNLTSLAGTLGLNVRFVAPPRVLLVLLSDEIARLPLSKLPDDMDEFDELLREGILCPGSTGRPDRVTRPRGSDVEAAGETDFADSMRIAKQVELSLPLEQRCRQPADTDCKRDRTAVDARFLKLKQKCLHLTE